MDATLSHILRYFVVHFLGGPGAWGYLSLEFDLLGGIVGGLVELLGGGRVYLRLDESVLTGVLLFCVLAKLPLLLVLVLRILTAIL